jgi:hypothetical protein
MSDETNKLDAPKSDAEQAEQWFMLVKGYPEWLAGNVAGAAAEYANAYALPFKSERDALREALRKSVDWMGRHQGEYEIDCEELVAARAALEVKP